MLATMIHKKTSPDLNLIELSTCKSDPAQVGTLCWVTRLVRKRPWSALLQPVSSCQIATTDEIRSPSPCHILEQVSGSFSGEDIAGGPRGERQDRWNQPG